MKRALYLLPFLSLFAATVACGGDDEPAPGADDDAGTGSSSGGSSSGASSSSGGSSGASSSSGGSSSGGEPGACEPIDFAFPADTAPALAADVYEDYLGVHPNFPFDVVGFYTSPVDIPDGGLGWDERGALNVSTPDGGNGTVTVHRLTPPSAATGALRDDALVLAKPADLFSPSYANYPPVHSLPDDRYVLSYTSQAVDGVVPGLAYLFAGDQLQQRAWSNGFFGAVGARHDDTTRMFFHAFSPFSATQNSTAQGAVYASDLCADGLVGEGCTASFPLFTTGTDSSGPVVKDARGDLFSTTYDGDKVNLRSVERCAALTATTTLDAPVVHAFAAGGSSAMAVVPSVEGLNGYVLHFGYPPVWGDPALVAAVAFTRDASGLRLVGEQLAAPLTLGTESHAIGAVADPQGYLWVALDTDDGTRVAKLRRRSTP